MLLNKKQNLRCVDSALTQPILGTEKMKTDFRAAIYTFYSYSSNGFGILE